MAEPTRPLPSLHEADTRPFWEATKNHELRFQRCADCKHVVFYPRQHCTACLGHSLDWETSAGEGTVYTYSVVRQNYHPFFRVQGPYAVAWIDLDEGFRMLSNVVGVDAESVSVGQRVKVDWEDKDGLALPMFTPA